MQRLRSKLTRMALALAAVAGVPAAAHQMRSNSVRTSSSDPTPTPRIYQQAEGTDIFAQIVAMQKAAASQPKSEDERRAAMVQQIRRNVLAAGSTLDIVELERALGAIGAVRREKFVPLALRNYAYLLHPLQIGYDQTISDAYIVAVMTAAVQLRPGQRVLDIGTGSGYQAAVASRLVRSVVSVEIVAPLASNARSRLRKLGYRNVEVITGDGFAGEPGRAPFDAIIVAAGAKNVPQPLLDQLRPGGRLVMPVGESTFKEQLLLFTKLPTGKIGRCSLGPAGFVPFTGQAALLEPGAAGDIAEIPLCYHEPVT